MGIFGGDEEEVRAHVRLGKTFILISQHTNIFDCATNLLSSDFDSLLNHLLLHS